MSVHRAYDRIRNRGLVDGGRSVIQDGSTILLRRIGETINYGQKPFERDWDILILLDACRYDLFEEFASDHAVYQRLESVESVYSCASCSNEWMEKAYAEEYASELRDTHLVSGNGWEMSHANLDLFGEVTAVWEHTDFDYGTIPPDLVTDAAVHAGRTTDCDRMIVHYMQPHAPFLHCAGKYDTINDYPGQGRSQNVWSGLQRGKYSFDEVWQDYGENLLTVLDELETLLNNISGDDVVISADHANAVGEFGCYGHPDHLPIPAVKRVPWARTSASDTGAYEPEDPIKSGVNTEDVDEHLEALGYKL